MEELTPDDKDVAIAQAVGFATYVEEHAKGEMVKAAKRFLALPYAQEIAKRLNKSPIDENTPRDGRCLLIFDDKEIDQTTGEISCQVARWKDGAWRYQHDEYTIDGTHFRLL